MRIRPDLLLVVVVAHLAGACSGASAHWDLGRMGCVVERDDEDVAVDDGIQRVRVEVVGQSRSHTSHSLDVGVAVGDDAAAEGAVAVRIDNGPDYPCC